MPPKAKKRVQSGKGSDIPDDWEKIGEDNTTNGPKENSPQTLTQSNNQAVKRRGLTWANGLANGPGLQTLQRGPQIKSKDNSNNGNGSRVKVQPVPITVSTFVATFDQIINSILKDRSLSYDPTKGKPSWNNSIGRAVWTLQLKCQHNSKSLDLIVNNRHRTRAITIDEVNGSILGNYYYQQAYPGAFADGKHLVYNEMLGGESHYMTPYPIHKIFYLKDALVVAFEFKLECLTFKREFQSNAVAVDMYQALAELWCQLQSALALL